MRHAGAGRTARTGRTPRDRDRRTARHHTTQPGPSQPGPSRPGPSQHCTPGHPRPSRARLTARRFARNRLASAGLALLVLLFLAAYAGPLLSPWDHRTHDFLNFLSGPSADHWWGTTQSGLDLYALTLRGLQKSLVIALLAGVLCTFLSAVVGAFAGYFGGWTDRVLTGCVDLLLVMPAFLVVAVLSPLVRGSGWPVFVVLLAAFSWMITGRVVRSVTLTLKERAYVKAARYLGVPGPVIVFRHILPNMASLLIIDAVVQAGAAVIGESGLSYFGFGVQPPDVSLGTVIADHTNMAASYPWLFFFPAGCLVLIGVALAFIGDGLRDALDPEAAGAQARAKRRTRRGPRTVGGAPTEGRR